MSDSVQFKLEGVDLLAIKVRASSRELKYKGGRAALRKAANIVATQARRNARIIDDPDTARSIARNIALRWNGRHFKRTGDIAFRVGVRHGAVLGSGKDKSVNAPTPHWRLLEFGTEKMQAHPFFRRALSEKTGDVIARFAAELDKELGEVLK